MPKCKDSAKRKRKFDVEHSSGNIFGDIGFGEVRQHDRSSTITQRPARHYRGKRFISARDSEITRDKTTAHYRIYGHENTTFQQRPADETIKPDGQNSIRDNQKQTPSRVDNRSLLMSDHIMDQSVLRSHLHIGINARSGKKIQLD